MRLNRFLPTLLAIALLCGWICSAETDVSAMSGGELRRLADAVQSELAANHTVDPNAADAAFSAVAAAADAYYAGNGITAAWNNGNDLCLSDWNTLSVTMHADFDKGGGITHTDAVCAFLADGNLIWLKCGTETVIDLRADVLDENGIRAFRENFPDDALPVPAETPAAPVLRSAAEEEDSDAYDWVLNTNTMKFHYPSCPSAVEMKESNRRDIHAARQEVIELGYTPCGRCNP